MIQSEGTSPGNGKLTVEEFAAKIKSKYPEYKDVDDVKLAKAIIEKYPEYEQAVVFETPKKKEGSQEPFRIGISELPSASTSKDDQVDNVLAFNDAFNPVGRIIKKVPVLAELNAGIESMVGSAFKLGEMFVKENVLAYATANPGYAAAQNAINSAAPVDSKLSEALGSIGDVFMESSSRAMRQKYRDYGIPDRDVELGIIGNIAEGNISSAAKLTASTMVQQVPQLAVMAATGGTAGGLILGATAAGGKYAEIQDDPTLTSQEKALYSLAIGTAEGIAENIFKTDVTQFRSIFGKTETLDAFKKELKKELKKSNLWKSSAEEATEEFLVAVTDNLIESGLKGNFDNWDRDAILEIADNTLIGGLMGGGVHSVSRGVNAIGTTKNERKILEAKKDVSDLYAKLENATEDQKPIIEELIEERLGFIIDNQSEDAEFYKNFTPEDLKSISELNKEIRKTSKKYNLAASESQKKVIKKELDELRSKKAEIENKYSENPSRYIKDGKEVSRSEFVEMINNATPEEISTGQWGVQNDDEVEQLLMSKLPQKDSKEPTPAPTPEQKVTVQEPVAEEAAPTTEVQEAKKVKLSDGSEIQEGAQVVTKNPATGNDIQGELVFEGDPDNPRVSVETETDIVELGVASEVKPSDIKPFTEAIKESETLTANEDKTLTYNKEGNPTIPKGTKLTIDTEKGLDAVSVFSKGKFVPLTKDADREKGLKVQMLNQDGEVVELYGQDALDATYNIMLAMNEAEQEQLNKLLDNEETINAIAEAEESARKDTEPTEKAEGPAVKENSTVSKLKKAEKGSDKFGDSFKELVDNFNKTLSNLGGSNIPVYVVDGDTYKNTTGKSSRGSFTKIDGKRVIIINADKASLGTVYHEMMHAYIVSANLSPKQLVSFVNSIKSELKKGNKTEKQLAANLEAFQEEYIKQEIYGKGLSLDDPNIAEEFVSEFVAQIKDNVNIEKMSISTIDKIRLAIAKILKETLGTSIDTAPITSKQEAFDFVNGFLDALDGRTEVTTEVNPERSAVINSKNPYEASRLQLDVPVGSRIANEPLKDARTIAISYMESKGLKHTDGNLIKKLDEKLSKRISDAYIAMKDNPRDPEVTAAYKTLSEETIDQHEAIIKAGYKVEVNNNEPYNNSNELIEDLRKNKNMRIFSTDSGFGDEGITAQQRKDNPMLAETKYKDVNGRTLLVNDIFRFVHDFFGHAERGNGFGPIGEENAWDVHSRMFSPLARKALTAETRGQNSYVNFSGVNTEAFKLRDKGRALRKEGKFEEAQEFTNKAYAIMKYAPQKVGLLPDEFVENPYLEGPAIEEEEQGESGEVGTINIPKQQIEVIDAPKLSEDTRSFVQKFVTDIKMTALQGRKFVTNMYDYTNAGVTNLGNGYSIDLLGGRNYVPLMMERNGVELGEVSNLAAFNSKTQAEGFIRNAIEGKADLFAPHSGTLDGSWQFQHHIFEELVNLILDNRIMSKSTLIDLFNTSIQNSEKSVELSKSKRAEFKKKGYYTVIEKKVPRKIYKEPKTVLPLKDEFISFAETYKEKTGKNIRNLSSFRKDPNALLELLNADNNYSPDLRKLLNGRIASNPVFQKAIGVKSLKEFYNRISDPLNIGVSGGEIMSFVEFDPKTFKVVKTKPGDVNHHPSFGWVVMAKIKGVYHPDKYYKSYDITESYTKHNVNEIVVEIKAETTMKKFIESNISSSAGAIAKVAEVDIPRQQIDVLNSVNPTGSVFVDYTPAERAKAKIGDNLTSLDKATGSNPDKTVVIYRGAPKSQKEIVPGDFITTNRKLAKDYAGTGIVLEKRVKMGDVLTDKEEFEGEEHLYYPGASKAVEKQKEQIDFAGIEMKVKETPADRTASIPTGGTAYVPVSTLYDLMDMRDGDRGGLYETEKDKKRVNEIAERFKKEGYNSTDGWYQPIYIDIDAGGFGWIGEGNHRVLAAMKLGMTHLPVKVEFGAARDDKFVYHKNWSRVPTQVVTEEKIEQLKEQAGPYYHIKYASIWETDLPTNQEPKADTAVKEQIDFDGSEMLNEVSWKIRMYNRRTEKYEVTTIKEKGDNAVAIKFPDGITAVARTYKEELKEAEEYLKDVRDGVYPYANEDDARNKRNILALYSEDSDFAVELLSKNNYPIGKITLANNHFDYYFPHLAKEFGEDYEKGLIYSADNRRTTDAVYIEPEYRGKGYGARLYHSALRLLREQVPGARIISNHDSNLSKSAKNFWRGHTNQGLAKVVLNTATVEEIEEMGGPEILKQLKDIGMEYTGDIYELLDPTEHITPSKKYDVTRPEVERQQIDWQPSLFGREKVNTAIITRSTQLQQAVQELLEGKITNAEYQEAAKLLSPVDPISQFFLPASDEDMKNALGKGKAKKLNVQLEDGEYVGLRLDIPAYVNNNIWVVTAHKGTGAPLTYGSVAWATDVKFGTNPKVAAFIAAGKNMDLVGRYRIEPVEVDGKTVYKFLDTKTEKYYAEKGKDVVKDDYKAADRFVADRLEKQDKSTIGKMLGRWKNFEGKTKEDRDASAIKKVEEIVKTENSYPGITRKGSPWRQIGMNPFRHSFFYDRRTGKPVVSAAEVVQIGGLVYAKDVEYADWSNDQFTVDGYYDADGQPVKFQIDGDPMDKSEKAFYKALEKGDIPKPTHKKHLMTRIWHNLFRTKLELKMLRMQESKEALVSRTEEKATFISNKIKKYAKTTEALELANEYLTSDNKKEAKEKILKLKTGPKLLSALREARTFIDNLSEKIIDDPAFSELSDDLVEAIEQNLTTYLRTQYRFFTDKNYNINKRRDPAIKAQFDQLVAQEMAMLKAEGLSNMDVSRIINERWKEIRDEAVEMIDGYIADLEEVKIQPSKGGAGIKLPNAPFKRKKDLPDYIENLLGKERNPINKFAQTTQALAHVYYKGKMVESIIDTVGLDSDYILREDPGSPKNKHYTKVNDPYSKLNGMWVHNEIMDSLDRKPLYSTDSPTTNFYYNVLKLARKSKVIWNITTWRKNLTGGWYFIMANGIANKNFAKDFTQRTNLMFKTTGEGKQVGIGKFKATFKVDEETETLLDIMAEYGVSGKNIDANVIGVSQASFQYGIDGNENSYIERLNYVLGNIKNKDKWLQQKYSAVDDYTKLIIFRSEIKTYAKKLFGKEYESLTEAQKDKVHEQAAERVKQSTPTFSRLPKWFDKVAGVPVVGDFVSFRLESLRSYGMNVWNGVDDIKKSSDPSLSAAQKSAYLTAGLRRLAGSGTVFALKFAIVNVLTQLFLGEDDEKLAEEAKLLRPEWMNGQTIIPRSIDKDGNVRVYNYSSEDPYGDVSDVFGGPESWSAMVKDFIRPNIAADLIFNLVKGEDIYGKKIADYSDSKINNILKVSGYVGKQIVVPPTISSSFRDAYLRSELPKGERIKDLASMVAERSVIRDYKYNIVNSLVQDLRKISETRKSYEDYDNPSLRKAQLDDIREKWNAVVAIGEAKGNYELIDKAERYIKRHLLPVDEDYVFYEE